MYRKFYGLAEAPFNLTPDSRFLFLSKRHREALAAVLYGLDQRKGFIVLTGTIGAGKTTICRALLTELDAEGARVAVILNSFLNDLELLQAINDEFQLPSTTDSRKHLIDCFNDFLLQQHAIGRAVAVVIDEAQHLSREALEQIRMLSNLETETEKLIQIVLIGQPELDDMLRRPELEQLNQRITVRYHLTPLSEAEMAQYIRHRLFVARARIEIEFKPEALRVIFAFSQGVPRKINLICDRILLAGYGEAVYVMDERLARRAAAELDGSSDGGALRVTTTASRAGKPRAISPLWMGVGLAVLAILCLAGAILLGYWAAKRRAPGSPATSGILAPGAVNSSEARNASQRPRPEGGTGDEGASNRPGEIELDDIGEGVVPGAATAKISAKSSRSRVRTPESLAWVFQEKALNGQPIRYLQVADEKHALAAAFCTLLDAWGETPDLESYKRGDEAAYRSVIHSYYTPGRRIRMVALDNKTLADALLFDLPLLLELDENATSRTSLAPYATLLHAQGEALTISDPFNGLRTVQLAKFSRLVTGISVLYRDANGWGSLTRGEESEAVLSLARFLKSRKFISAGSVNRYDVRMEEGIRKFQKYYRLDGAGELDSLTQMLLATQADSARPRLYAQESGM